MRYILANIETKMPLLCTDDIEAAIAKYLYLTKCTYEKEILSYLEYNGYCLFKDYIIIDDNNYKILKKAVIRDTYDESHIILSELIDYIKINIRKIKIDNILH